MDRKNVRMMVNLTGGTGDGPREQHPALETARTPAASSPSPSRRTAASRTRLPADPGRRDRAGEEGRRARAEGPEDPRPLPARGPDDGAAREGRRQALRPDVGRLRGARAAGVHPRLRPGGVLPPHRPLQRALRGAVEPSRLVVPRPGLPEQRARCMEARDRVFARHPKTHVRACCTWATTRRTWASSPSTLDRFPNTSVEMGARVGELGRQPRASRKFFEKYQDRILFGTDAVPRAATRPRSRSSATSCTRSTTASSRPRTSTSTTRPRRCRRRDAGGSTASACPSPS